MKTIVALLSVLALIIGATALAGGDAAMGEKVFEAQCAECHYEDDFSGDSEADIAAAIKPLVDGSEEHEADISGLTAEDVANASAYFASQ